MLKKLQINMKEKYINLILTSLLYAILGLIVYWGTLLAVFSFYDYFRSIKLSPSILQLVYGLIGLVAWLNAWHYFTKLKKYSAHQMWRLYYQKEKKKIYLTIVLTVLALILLSAFRRGIPLNSLLTNLAHLSTIPWTIGQTMIFLVNLNVRRYLPVLEPINQLGWILSLIFEFVFFYYVSRIILWRPRKRQKKLKENYDLTKK